MPDREDGFKPNPVDPLTRVMVYAAGAIAEALLLNISRSAGFAGDLRKINRVRDEFARKASTAYIAAQALSDGAHARAIAEVHEAQTRLAEVELEISSDYPRTRSMLEECRAALQALAEFAIARLSELEHLDGTMIDGTILVTSDEVQSLWNSHSSGTA